MLLLCSMAGRWARWTASCVVAVVEKAGQGLHGKLPHGQNESEKTGVPGEARARWRCREAGVVLLSKWQ